MHRGLQPALVDTSACYCRVDAITAVGAKRLVPGARHCVQPDLKPSIQPKRNRVPKGERKKLPPDLIPGLPNDLVVACLLRVPRLFHRKLRLVCRKWYRLLTSNYYFSQRIQLGIAEEWIYVIKRDRDGRVAWHTFDPKYQVWQPLPPIPAEYSEVLGFGSAVLCGYLLFLFGEMLRRRHFFASCVINNCLYVAGGECEGIQRSLRSAEMFDPNKNKWCFISDMSTAMVPFIGVVYRGEWFVKGLGTHRQVMSEVYSPASNHWSPIFDGMVAGWRNPCTSLNGRLYALDCPDGCRLRVFDHATGLWNKSVDSKLHLGNSQAFEAAAMVPLGGKLCVVRNNLSMVLVDVANMHNSAQLWENMGGKGHFKSVVSNLWSNISGRSKSGSHVVHCQVLQA
ncbi:hypothetical protein GOP47_0019987 [Adiantum capillus-veneris]|uniref:F-box domain-containing protein n=1 Tax=Adiantum capillus-veneris TaxID=13818 RepID=A0A9D4UCT9_ADICA|nr:hypothetical protein GOP47_0019987 [Adiantum capillus-veneris]